ncbi:chloride channel protein [Azospirillum picis]|uniref:H+/Cl- antiporter ClcA n=1 Tax=Azospirillum picis TaxID=488438 RepID=A0ABU0MCR0_9PROT|nr:chloride channel protein [Azospirillum picis]MBP2297762.1 H+/Cl- antiporter ClcA [Azospirillum picis]MDQ0531215.1 H+/Cl- antiporter ClcA [Azospirillum picis]
MSPSNSPHHALPPRLRRPRHVWVSPTTWRRRLLFWAGAGAVGLIAVLFAVAADYAQALFQAANGALPWLPFLMTPAGLALSAWVALRVVPGSQGSGIPQAIAARHLQDPAVKRRLLSPRIAVGKILLTLLGLACGASIGREGPTVQIGASVMLVAGSVAGLGREPGLILAGGAAGVAAAFNTPLAGIVFAIEEMARSFEKRTSSLVLVAVVAAGLVAIAIQGNYAYFGHTAAAVGWHDWEAVLAAGILGGLAGGGFSSLLLWMSAGIRGGFGGRLARHPVLVAAGCGLALAAIGFATGGLTFGTGYEQARATLDGMEVLPWYYAPAKLLATALSGVCGIPGGIFSPSLSVGAGIGSLIGGLLPDSPQGAVVLLSMVGYFAGVVQAPLTAVIIVTEMSASPDMLLPLMVSAMIATTLSRLVCPRSVYHAMAEGFLDLLKAGEAGKAAPETAASKTASTLPSP